MCTKNCGFGTKSFKFLHIGATQIKDTLLENIQYTIEWIKDNVKNIADQILIINATIINSNGKNVCNNNKMGNVIKDSEKQNEEPQNKL